MGVEIASKSIEIVRDAMRLMAERARFDKPRIARQLAQDGDFPCILQPLEGCSRKHALPLSRARQSGKELARIAQHRTAARMPVLHVKDRVIARLLDDLEQVEIEHSIIAAVEHHEANGVAADFIHDLTQGHEVTGTLRHFHRLAGPQELHQLDDLDVEIG